MFKHTRLLLSRLAIAMAFFSFYRVVFYISNKATLGSISFPEWFWVWLGGWRFDLSAVLYTNLLVTFLHLVPLKSRDKKWWQQMTLVVFMLSNGAAMVLEWGDIAYFPFNFRRLLLADFAMQDDAQNLLPSFLHDYWYMFIGYFVVLYGMYRLYRRTMRKREFEPRPVASNWRYYTSQTLIMLFLSGISIIGLRGGLQLIPLMPINAGEYVSDKRQMSLVSNTTLNIIMSFEQRSLAPVHYFDDKNALAQLYTLRHEPDTTAPFKRMNVVILALESYGKELTGAFNPNRHEYNYTPFFDSLVAQSAYFTHSYANGTRSVQGITSLVSSIPYLMPDPFVWSSYQSNRCTSLGAELKKLGYKTAFFHGGHNGTMSFDRLCLSADINRYYGMTEYNQEYPNNPDYDGSWGIWDTKFFDFFLKKVKTDLEPEPFFATYFTLMPHPPYVVEDWFKKAHPDVPEGRPLAQLYADYCLQDFFKKAKQTTWFNNTLFVLSADHIGQPIQHDEYNTPEARYSIPILFYCPSDSSLVGERGGTIQQIDAFPTVLKYLHFPYAYSAFGKALDLHGENGYNYQYVYTGDFYQITDGHYLLQSKGDIPLSLFDLSTDPACKKDIKAEQAEPLNRLNTQLKAVLQTHYDAMTHNLITK